MPDSFVELQQDVVKVLNAEVEQANNKGNVGILPKQGSKLDSRTGHIMEIPCFTNIYNCVLLDMMGSQ